MGRGFREVLANPGVTSGVLDAPELHVARRRAILSQRPFGRGLLLPGLIMVTRLIALVTLGLLAWSTSSAVAGVGSPMGTRGAARGVAIEPTPVSVVVSIPPLKGIAAELGKGLNVEVQTLIPVGVSEHGYEIPASKFRALAKADVIVYVGRGLEPELAKYLRDHPADAGGGGTKRLQERVEFAALIGEAAETHDHDAGHEKGEKPAAPAPEPAKKPEPAHDHDHDAPGHVHGPECDHDHDGADPHLWLDAANMKKLVPAVRGAIEHVLKSRGELSAEAKASLEQAEASLVKRIDAVDAAYHETLEGAKGRTIVVAHNAYGMLAARYHLETVAIAGLHASEPTMNDVKKAIEAIKQKKAGVVYVEPQLSRSAGERVAKATSAKVLVLDPVGGDDWFVTMNKNLDALAEGLGVPRRPTK